MRRFTLTQKLVIFVLALALIEGGLMGGLLHAAGAQRPGFVLLAAGVGAFLTALVGLFVVRQVTRPLAKLSRAARQIGDGDLRAPITFRSADELGDLADALREMQTHLVEMYEGLERRVEARTVELRETTEFLEAVLESSTEYAIVATDESWHVQVFNEGARRIFGYEPDEMIGRSLETLVPADEREAAMGTELRRLLAQRGRAEGEGVRIRKGGERFPVRCVTTVRHGPEGRTIGYTVICRDITQQRALEERLSQYTDNLEHLVAEKTAELQQVNAELRRANRLKGQFLATMSHELRTPLNAIIGFAEAIRDGIVGEVSTEQREFAEDINQAGHQLLDLINNILDMAKLEAGAMNLDLQPCDLAGMVDEVFRVTRGLARQRQVELATDIRPRPLQLTADPVKLKQVLYNLLANAVKFSKPGDTVHLEAQLEPETIIVRVIDTGVGIAPEDQVWIFEEFRQADVALSDRPEGTGLGLALTKRLVELHGGDIVVESEMGKGTTFTVTLLRDLVPE